MRLQALVLVLLCDCTVSQQPRGSLDIPPASDPQTTIKPWVMEQNATGISKSVGEGTRNGSSRFQDSSIRSNLLSSRSREPGF
ncbi:uncharacterized protein LOC119951222 isoform X2 [Scyliorhinus canicula]|uniref:uncharacterized protein LOC119951222 isoform X2 n=1 Tax=Scyliorhinus canicula TaxID=7830 RepID=UPI0018F44E37|nr:uncharacterized protein LOC119951222 isoform X2 [Scyliorhinus canicula]